MPDIQFIQKEIERMRVHLRRRSSAQNIRAQQVRERAKEAVRAADRAEAEA